MSDIEGSGTKKSEAPSNIISHRFRELNQPVSVDQLKRVAPWKVNKSLRVIAPVSEKTFLKRLIWQSSKESSHVTHILFIRMLLRNFKIMSIIDPDIADMKLKKFIQFYIRFLCPTLLIGQVDPELAPHGVETYLIDQKLLDYDLIDAMRQQLNERTVHKNPDAIDVIKECDMTRSEAVDNLHETNKLWFTLTDSEGRLVFLPEARLAHIALEVRPEDYTTRLEQLVCSWVISNNIFSLIQLIHEIVTTVKSEEKEGDRWWRDYRKVFNGKEVRISTAKNGMIVTMF